MTAQIRRVGMSRDLLREGEGLDAGSRLAVEIDLFNADAQRTLTVLAPRLLVADAYGGSDIVGRPVASGERGIPGLITMADVEAAPRPVTLRPGEGRTIWVAYAGFPTEGPRGPLRARIHLDVPGEAPLELALADPIPGGPRWRSDERILALAVGGGFSPFVAGSRAGKTDIATAPIAVELMRARGRLFWGVGARFELLYREAVASGPATRGMAWQLTIGFLPWRFPVGVYGQAGFLYAFENPPEAYRQLDGARGDILRVPRLGAGLVLQGGARLHGGGPFGVERPLSTLRRFHMRVGYVQWFGLGSSAGAGAIEVVLGGVIGS